jgi:acetyl esterase/lipase
MKAQEVIPLYRSDIPNSKRSPDKETKEDYNGIPVISKISTPSLTIFLPPKDKANGCAIVICPGGGYWVNAYIHEGTDVAKKFNEMGVAAFVLKYRIPEDETMIDKQIGPLQDAQQAIRMVKQNSKLWNVDPQRVGILGFSAGGHLASTAGTHFSKPVLPASQPNEVRPDFMILIYPVISFLDSVAHVGSREKLLGKDATIDKIRFYSSELQVTEQTPPTFLVHASDDDVVKSENSVVFYQQLVAHSVPAELHIYQKGGHGFGMNNPTTSDRWIDRCKNWLISSGWIK